MKHIRLVRYLAYTIELMIFFMIQQTPGLVPSVFGVLPTVLVPAACAVALFESPSCALLFGVFSGFLLDYGTGSTFGLHALILGVSCFIVSFLVQDLFQRNFLTGMIMILAVTVLVTLLQWLFLYALRGYDSAFYVLLRYYATGTAYTLCTAPLFYYLNRGFSYLLHRTRQKP